MSSPIPWQKGTISGDDAWVFDANGQWVADFGQESARAFADRDTTITGVNYHDRLVEALTALLFNLASPSAEESARALLLEIEEASRG